MPSSRKLDVLRKLASDSTLSELSPQSLALEQNSETGIRTERVETGIDLEVNKANIMCLVGGVEPLESTVLVSETGIY